MVKEIKEGLFLDIDSSDREVITRVLTKLNLEYSPNGIIRAFHTLDKLFTLKDLIAGKGNLLDVFKKFIK